jgi:hypothetical protein
MAFGQPASWQALSIVPDPKLLTEYATSRPPPSANNTHVRHPKVTGLMLQIGN